MDFNETGKDAFFRKKLEAYLRSRRERGFLASHHITPYGSAASAITRVYTVSQKTSPTFSTVTWKSIIRFWQFLAQKFQTQIVIKWLFSFPSHPTFVSALPGENTTSEILLFYPMRYVCLINITRKNTFCSHFWHFGWHFIQLSIFQLPVVKLLKVLVYYANTGKETLSPFIDSSINKVLLQTNPGCTSCFLTSQTFLNFINFIFFC